MNAQTPIRKRRKKAVTLSTMPTSWDGGATGPANRDRLREEPAPEFDPQTGKETENPNNIRRNRRVDVVEVYAKDGLISRRELAAATNLRSLAEGIAARDPLSAIKVDVPTFGGLRPEELKCDRRRAFWNSWRLVPSECRDVVEKAVIQDIDLEDAYGQKMYEKLEAYAKLRVGLQAILEA